MKILDDYHTHTKYSHGVGTIEDNIESAIKKNLKTIAITDHGPGYKEYGIDIGSFKKIKEEIKFLKEKYKDKINILLGIEANIINKDGVLDVDESILKELDILLVGFHFDIVYKEFLESLRNEKRRNISIKNIISNNMFLEIEHINTEAMIKAVKNYNIDILTHINDNFYVDVLAIAKAASKNETAIEINNFHKNPNIKSIKEMSKIENLKFSVGSDAHRPKDVGNFTMALKKIEKCGILKENILNKAYENK